MKLHKTIAKAIGYDLTRRKFHPSFDSHLINLINHNNIDVVLDVGANDGQFALNLRSEGYKGEIHSFEPVSIAFENLKRSSLNDKKWFSHKLALGSECGKQSINISEGSHLSSFLNPNDYGKKKFESMKVSSTETVQVATIDDYLTTKVSNINKRNILLKMDTQGYDLEVFKGATNTLQYINCIISEISFTAIYSKMPHYLDSLRKYEEYGFVITGIYPINRNEDDLSLIEADCFMVNSKK